MSIFAEKLKHLMDRDNVQGKEVAVWLGVVPSMISRYLNGDRRPQSKKIAILAKKFNVTSDYFLKDTVGVSDYQENPILSSFEYDADASDMKEIINLLSGSSPEARENAIKILKALNEPKK